MKSKFKGIMLLITAFALVLVVSGCSKKEDSAKEQADTGPITPITKNYVKPDVINQKFKDGETFAFAIVDKDCSACQFYKKETLIKFEEEKLGEINLIEINKIADREEELMALTDLIQQNLQNKFEATPTTYFVKNGQLIDVVVGAIEVDELKEYYNKLDSTKSDKEETSKVDEKSDDKEETSKDNEKSDKK